MEEKERLRMRKEQTKNGKSEKKEARAGRARRTSGTREKKMRIWTFSRRLLALCILPMLAVCILVSAVSTSALKNAIENEIQNSLVIVAASVNETYTNVYEGDYTVDFVGAVRKGDKKLNGDFQLVDALCEKTGFHVSLLFGNLRMITTLKNERGARANGTPADKEVYARIETGEEFFLKDVVILGTESYVFYQPLVNSDGTILGAIEVVKDSESIQTLVRSQTTRIILLSLLFAVAAGAAVSFISHGMVVRMDRIWRFLGRLADGKLGHEPNQKDLRVNDELGDIYRNCVSVQETFQRMVREIKTSCDNLKDSAEHFFGMAQALADSAGLVQVSVEEIAKGAKMQASSMENAHSDIEMISSQIDLITCEMDSMTDYAADMSEREQKSVEVIGELSRSNDNTKASVLRVEEQVGLIESAVDNIKKAVVSTQEIADQTDLLSINASIEAARAGSAGRGFAVVAEEIIKLSQQSNQSSEEIKKILQEIGMTSARMVEVMAEVQKNMDAQQTQLEETKHTSSIVAEGAGKSLQNIQNVKEKIDVLNASGLSISEEISSLAQISAENVASAENTAETVQSMSGTMQQVKESSQELLYLADRLQEVVGKFSV